MDPHPRSAVGGIPDAPRSTLVLPRDVLPTFDDAEQLARSGCRRSANPPPAPPRRGRGSGARVARPRPRPGRGHRRHDGGRDPAGHPGVRRRSRPTSKASTSRSAPEPPAGSPPRPTSSRRCWAPKSQPLDHGDVRTPASAEAQRRAMALRDGGCVFCGAPPGWCEAAHLDPWALTKRPTSRTAP